MMTTRHSIRTGHSTLPPLSTIVVIVGVFVTVLAALTLDPIMMAIAAVAIVVAAITRVRARRALVRKQAAQGNEDDHAYRRAS